LYSEDSPSIPPPKTFPCTATAARSDDCFLQSSKEQTGSTDGSRSEPLDAETARSAGEGRRWGGGGGNVAAAGAVGDRSGGWGLWLALGELGDSADGGGRGLWLALGELGDSADGGGRGLWLALGELRNSHDGGGRALWLAVTDLGNSHDGCRGLRLAVGDGRHDGCGARGYHARHHRRGRGGIGRGGGRSRCATTGGAGGRGGRADGNANGAAE